MKIKCPSCATEFDLIAALDSEAGRELVGLLAKLDASISRPLTVYLSLFRSHSRALSWDRALRLAKEVMILEANHQRLGNGLAKAVESLRDKQGGWQLETHGQSQLSQAGIGRAARRSPCCA